MFDICIFWNFFKFSGVHKLQCECQMDFFDKFKRFLGLPARQGSPNFDDQDRLEPPFHSRSFSMFTDPIEMHKYFEQQMSEMLSSFGFSEFGQFNFPQIEEFNDDFNGSRLPDEGSASTGKLRDQFLKPGYEKATSEKFDEKRDSDIDGKLDIRDWGSVFKGENSVVPYHRQVVPKTRFFGQSITTRSVRNPDGSVEKHHTVKDNEGNEETTITRKVGDKEYSITKRKDQEGKEETIENIVNLDEKEIDKFFPKQPEFKNQSWPFFDRFFT